MINTALLAEFNARTLNLQLREPKLLERWYSTYLLRELAAPTALVGVTNQVATEVMHVVEPWADEPRRFYVTYIILARQRNRPR